MNKFQKLREGLAAVEAERYQWYQTRYKVMIKQEHLKLSNMCKNTTFTYNN